MKRTQLIGYLLTVSSSFLPIMTVAASAPPAKSKLISELQLTAVHNYLQLWDLGDCEQSAQLKTKISQSITEAVIIIRSASPSIADLDGKALESLCILHENLHILDYAEDKFTKKLAIDYIDSVSEEVIERIQKHQRSMKGQGCLITPENL